MSLKEIKFGENQFCGPSVISAIVGCDTDEATKVLQIITGRKKITGVFPTELVRAFNYLKCECEPVSVLKHSSLYFILTTLNKSGHYVVMIPGHFIAIEITDKGERIICDNRTKKPINAVGSARLGQSVQQVVRISKLVENKFEPIICYLRDCVL